MSQAYQHPVTAAGALRLHLNENTAGCSPKVIEALRALGRDDIALYPDYDAVYRETAQYLAAAHQRPGRGAPAGSRDRAEAAPR